MPKTNLPIPAIELSMLKGAREFLQDALYKLARVQDLTDAQRVEIGDAISDLKASKKMLLRVLNENDKRQEAEQAAD